MKVFVTQRHIDTVRLEISQLDKYYPPCGECMLCGHKDKRHRMWDMFLSLSDSDAFVAHLYDVPVEYVKLVRQIKPYQKRLGVIKPMSYKQKNIIQ